MDEQWGYVGAKSRQRWLFYAYDRIRRTVVAHVFGERTHTGASSDLNRVKHGTDDGQTARNAGMKLTRALNTQKCLGSNLNTFA
jgi:hypothetical protein